MRYTIYKSLDRKNSLFGLKGSYITWAAFGLAGAAMAGALIGSMTNGLVGLVLFLGLAAGVYFAVLRFQARYSERERAKYFASRRLPDFVVVPPVRMRNYVIFKKKTTQKKK